MSYNQFTGCDAKLPSGETVQGKFPEKFPGKCTAGMSEEFARGGSRGEIHGRNVHIPTQDYYSLWLTNIQTHRLIDGQTNIQTHRLIDGQTYIQTHRLIDGQTAVMQAQPTQLIIASVSK